MTAVIPFAYPWLIKKNLDKAKVETILELGCGKGWFADLVNDQNQYEITGVDIFNPHLDICIKKGLYKKVVRVDISKKLEFKENSFDAVVCLQTIEHLNKKEGETLLSEIEKIASKLVIITTPVGECSQEEYDGNKYQHHLSIWYPGDFKERGYLVAGVGLKLVYGSHSLIDEQKSILRLPFYLFSFLMNPVANMVAEIACQMVATKRLDKKKEKNKL